MSEEFSNKVCMNQAGFPAGSKCGKKAVARVIVASKIKLTLCPFCLEHYESVLPMYGVPVEKEKL